MSSPGISHGSSLVFLLPTFPMIPGLGFGFISWPSGLNSFVARTCCMQRNLAQTLCGSRIYLSSTRYRFTSVLLAFMVYRLYACFY